MDGVLSMYELGYVYCKQGIVGSTKCRIATLIQVLHFPENNCKRPVGLSTLTLSKAADALLSLTEQVLEVI